MRGGRKTHQGGGMIFSDRGGGRSESNQKRGKNDGPSKMKTDRERKTGGEIRPLWGGGRGWVTGSVKTVETGGVDSPPNRHQSLRKRGKKACACQT